MAALGLSSTPTYGRLTNGEFEVWDLFPRNVLKDCEGDIFVLPPLILMQPSYMSCLLLLSFSIGNSHFFPCCHFLLFNTHGFFTNFHLKV